MATTLDQREGASALAASSARGIRRPAGVVLAILAIAVAGYAASQSTASDDVAELIRAATVGLWAIAGATVVVRRPAEPLGFIILAGTLIGALGSGGAVIAGDASRGAGARDIGAALRWVSFGLLPVVGMHLLVGLPDGRIVKRGRRRTLMVWYGMGGAVGVAAAVIVGAPDGGVQWLVFVIAGLTVVGVLAMVPASTARYNRARGLERQRMQWSGLAVTVGAVIAVVLAALRVLADVQTGSLMAALATAPIPIALAISASPAAAQRVDRMLAHTVAIGGLTGLVVVVYLLVVVGLGRVPDESERTLLLLSMGAAAVAALLYLPTRERLNLLANRIVYGELHAPDEVLRTFGSRMSRAIAMDELLLQLAESLRKTFALDAVEVWTGQEGVLERTASVPERGHARMTVGERERPVFARAGVTGNAWLAVWMPALLEGREGAMVRAAPIVHSGELLGFILVERKDAEEQLGDENERILTELARQVALALHNVQLDSALQETLDEVRQQADELRRSRERIVAAADAAREKMRGDLHDGAQQNLVALAVKMKLLTNLLERDPGTAKQMAEDLAVEAQETVQAVRAFAHGIYPPVLSDRGLLPALESAAQKSAIPTVVEAIAEIPRYQREIEAAVYFTCMEALTNASKHAGEGASVTIKVREDAGVLFFEVADSGAGFDMAGKGLGAGFTNMADRVGAVGGTFEVHSALGQGTKVTGRIPIAAT